MKKSRGSIAIASLALALAACGSSGDSGGDSIDNIDELAEYAWSIIPEDDRSGLCEVVGAFGVDGSIDLVKQDDPEWDEPLDFDDSDIETDEVTVDPDDFADTTTGDFLTAMFTKAERDCST
ncbi:hypothetical protein N9Q18_00895 [bacterium]|nr:hypothetical protein [bacterium]